jgi:hypothetical protein
MRAALPGCSRLPTLPAGNALRHRQADPDARHVGHRDGIAIHRRIVERRRIDGCRLRLREDPSIGVQRRQRFDFGDRRCCRKQAGKSFFKGQHRLSR